MEAARLWHSRRWCRMMYICWRSTDVSSFWTAWLWQQQLCNICSYNCLKYKIVTMLNLVLCKTVGHMQKPIQIRKAENYLVFNFLTCYKHYFKSCWQYQRYKKNKNLYILNKKWLWHETEFACCRQTASVFFYWNNNCNHYCTSQCVK